MQCSLGRAIWWRREEQREEKNWEMDRWSGKGKTLHLHLWKTSSIVEICLQLFGGFHLTAVISFSPLLSLFFLTFPQKGECVWKQNTFFTATKSRKELLLLQITPAERYRNISVIFLMLS